MRRFLLPGLLGLLASCGPQFVADTLYPDGEVVAFRSSDGDSLMKYACAAAGPGGATVKSRAAAAHRFFERESERFASDAAEAMIDGIADGKPSAAMAAKLDREADAFAEMAFIELKRQYACAMIEMTD